MRKILLLALAGTLLCTPASAADYTPDQVGAALTRLGHYRVVRVQEVAGERVDVVGGPMMLATGLRETGLRNIEGGAILDPSGRWVPQPDPNKKDVGFTQISRLYHMDGLRLMPGVQCGTWSPVVVGKTAGDGGYCGRFTDETRYTADEMSQAEIYGRAHGVADSAIRAFVIAAHNAGIGGAMAGYRSGNVDRYTTGGDYSAWVLRHVTLVKAWLRVHPAWRL